MSNDNVKERWYKPVNRIGRITLTLAMIASFGPFIYLYIRYGGQPDGGLPPMNQVAAGVGAVLASYVAYYIIEPISYFPALGTAGTYMGILAGSIGQMRVPAALVAKNVAGVKEDTQEAEIVATAGIAGSIFTNIIVTTITALFGTILLAVLPDVIKSNMSTYVIPAIYGGVGAMLATNMMLFIPCLALLGLINGLRTYGPLSGLPAWAMAIIGVVAGVTWGRIAYVKKIVK